MLKICQTIFGAINVLLSAVENIVPPKASQILIKTNQSETVRYLFKSLLKIILASLFFTLIIYLLKAPIFSQLFGLKGNEFNWVIIWYGIIYIFIVLNTFTQITLRTLEYNKPIFIASLITTLVSLSLGIKLIRNYELIGSFIGISFIQIINLATYSFGLKKVLHYER